MGGNFALTSLWLISPQHLSSLYLLLASLFQSRRQQTRTSLSLCFRTGVSMKVKRGTCFVALPLPYSSKSPVCLSNHLWFPLAVQLPAPNWRKVRHHCPNLARPSAMLGTCTRVTVRSRPLRGCLWFIGSLLPTCSILVSVDSLEDGGKVRGPSCSLFGVLHPEPPLIYWYISS